MTYFQSAKVGDILKQQESKNKVIACICAAPMVLSSHKIGSGKQVTSHPVVEDLMKEAGEFNDSVLLVKEAASRSSGGGGEMFL